MIIYNEMVRLIAKRVVKKVFLLSCIILVLSACDEKTSQAGWGAEEDELMINYLEGKDDYTITIEALKHTYVYGALSTYGPYTFLCPTNEAWETFFQKHNITGLDQLEESLLESLFEYHVLPFEKKLENFENGPMSAADTTINGQRLLVDISGGLDNVIINNKSTITKGNIETWNGIIHVLDNVLDPPVNLAGDFLKLRPEFSSFVSFLELHGVMDTLMMRYSTVYPYISNEFSVFALTNEAMQDLQPTIDSLADVDMKYEAEVARDPQYADLVMPDQVRQLARSFILEGVDYVSTMYSGYKKTLGVVPYGDGIMRMKIVKKENAIIINDKAKVSFDNADFIMENGLVHRCEQAFEFLPESPREYIYSAAPMERWNTNLGALVSLSKAHGYLGDSENVYGIVNLEPEKVGAEFWVEVPNVPAGKYEIVLIANKQGSKAKIIVDEKVLYFDGADSDGSYDFSYLLGNRGRVDDLIPNPCSSTGLNLFEIPTGTIEVNPDQDFVTVKFYVTYLNVGGARIGLSAIIFRPLAE